MLLTSFIAKIKKGSDSVDTGDRVMVLCNVQVSSRPFISESSFIKLKIIFNTFKDAPKV